MLLSACITDTRELPAPLRVDAPRICQEIMKEVDKRPFGPDDDAIAGYLQRDAEVDLANDTIRTGANCLGDQNRLYAGQGERP